MSYLLDEINKNKTITLEDLKQKLQDKYDDAVISISQLHRVINDNNITLKLTRIRHEPIKRFGKDIDINSKISDFYNELTPFNLSIADLYNPEIAYGDCSDITKAIYRLQSNSCQFTSKYAEPEGSAFEM